MKCEETILRILNSVQLECKRPEQLVESWNSCLKELCNLDEGYSSTLSHIAQKLLDELEIDQLEMEDKLWMVLEAISRRKQSDALDKTIAALFSKKTKHKEEYVDILSHLEDKRAVPALEYALKLDSSLKGEWIRYKAINALFLLESKNSAYKIIPYVKDSVEKVRGAAIDFLVEFDIREAIPAFIDQIKAEDDPDNLESLIAGLVQWKQVEVLPVLTEILSRSWVQSEEDLTNTVEEAISILLKLV